MKINLDRLNVELAKRSMSISALRPAVSQYTIKKITDGEDLKPRTVGRVAGFLHIDVTDII